jgi:hypothetical protein
MKAGRQSPIKRFLKRAPYNPEFYLFVVVFLCSAFFTEISYQTTNFRPRLLLAEAIVDRHTFVLDAYKERLIGDGSYYEGHYYSDKPLGSSLMMIPQYLLVGKPARFILSRMTSAHVTDRVSSGLVLVFSLPLYASLMFVALYRILGVLGLTRRRFLLTLTCYFGTLMFPFSTSGHGEMYTAPLILWGVYCLLKSRSNRDYLYAGLLLGFACLATYQAILIAASALMFFVLWRKGLASRILFALPVVLFLLVILAYNRTCFGSFLSFPTKYWMGGNPRTVILEVPILMKFADMLFLPWKGIFFYSPFLLLCIPGYRKLLKTQSLNVVSFLVFSFVFYFVFLAFNAGWYGGADFGFRYIVPVLPFLCIGAAAWMSRETRLSPIEMVLVVLSIAVCSFGAITDPHVVSTSKFPLVEYNLPYFISSATNNMVNHMLEKSIGFNVWPFRLATTMLFFGAIGLILLSYRRHEIAKLRN